ALLIDFFCSAALDVGAELGVPTYFFLTTCVASVALCLYQPVIHEGTTLSFREMGGDPVRAPGLPPIPADHLAAAVMDRESLSNRHFLELSQRICDSRGVLVNSCRSLEPRAADAIVSGLCTPPGLPTPPVYCIGPLIKPDEETGTTKRHECLAWLDGQPEASVVFLCFGSMGRFSAEQVKEMASGLEASGQRFLWVRRRRPRLGRAVPGGLPEADQGQGPGGHVLGAAAAGAGARRRRRLRDALRLELGAGSRRCGRAHAGMAAVRGAAHEQSIPRRGDAAGRAHGRVRQEDGRVQRGGGEGAVADRVGRREGAPAADARGHAAGGGGAGRRR
uniref:UDP-glycosyltransferases domain-containing protein n=1 Tax=Aegilops tauschii subsp. strangulata TaxID=200361 RepID=A0A453M6X2_AEGTS